MSLINVISLLFLFLFLNYLFVLPLPIRIHNEQIVSAPDELRVRVLLRNEFFALGLDDGLLASLFDLSHTSDALAAQISTFTDLLEDGIKR
jgi:Diaphanous FH3 Domain